MEAKEYKRNAHARKYVRAKVTRLCNDVAAGINSFELNKVLQCISALNEESVLLKEADNVVLSNLWDESQSDTLNEAAQTKELDVCDQYKVKMNECIVALESRRLQLQSSNVTRNVSRLKPETAPLPTYSGEAGESLEKFLYVLEATVAAHQYTEFEKLLMLQKCVQGRASVLLKSLETDKQSYADAKTLLQDAFAAPLMQTYNVLQRLVDLNLSTNKDPLFLVSEMRQIREAIGRHKVNINTVIQFFYWRALPESLKNQLIMITNESKPNLDQIESNIFVAIERDQNKNKGTENKSDGCVKSKTNNYAMNIEYVKNDQTKSKSGKTCTLCSGSHPYFQCDSYKTPVEKLKRIRELNGCVRCGYVNHTANKCKLNDLKCKICGGAHFPCLCTKPKKVYSKSESKSNPEPETFALNVNNSVVWTSQAETSKSGLALPTFSCNVGDETVRVMRDTGAQATLVLDSLAEKCNLPVVDRNVVLTINGFNGSKNYVTKVVAVPLNIEGKVETINAICVPEININLNVPLIGILVDKLTSKGCILADKLLSKESIKISDIQLVLGADYAYCNPIKTEVFGRNHDSTLLISPNGIMIEGNVDKLINDVEYFEIGCVESRNITSYSVCSSDKVYVADVNGRLSPEELQRAADDILDAQCLIHLGTDNSGKENSVELNTKLTTHVYDNTYRTENGRLVMPLMWNSSVQHLLGNNENLAKQILKSNFKKLSKDKEKLLLTDKVFQEQQELGIIQRIENFEQFKEENPQYSFLPHMSVFRMNKETTKCRVVYLSNITEINPSYPATVSHNQAIMSGPNLNQKLSSALLLLRFDTYLLVYDLVKAFLMIAMNKVDQSRLLLMWYRNVAKGDFTIVHYKAMRLPFGISCAPSLLMLALYKILVLDDDECDRDVTRLRRLAYTLIYMDNGSFTCNDVSQLQWARKELIKIFGSYQFNMQQFVCNDVSVQEEMDGETGTESPRVVGLFGLKYDRVEDSLSTGVLRLDPSADTKRRLLKSYAENFDIFGFNVPLLNRAKLFIHRLQCNSEISWDDRLGGHLQKEWQLICRQLNASTVQRLPRCLGDRNSSYKLIAFTDASRDLFGTVVFIQDLATRNVNFLLSKNRVVGKNLKNKSIPSLELNALSLGVEAVFDVKHELCSDKLCNPIKVAEMQIYTDSMISLNWLDGITNKLSKKQNKLSVFVRNRLFQIQKACEEYPVTFSFIAGEQNPADQVTRIVSSKQLNKSNFYSGPGFLSSPNSVPNLLSVTVPCPSFAVQSVVLSDTLSCQSIRSLIPVENYSSFAKYVRVYSLVLKFVRNLKLKRILENSESNELNLVNEAKIHILKCDQRAHFPECVDYFVNSSGKRSVPLIISQLNVFSDSNGLLRVRGKLNLKCFSNKSFPILLSKDSRLVDLIISSTHVRMGHTGKYSVLTEMRKEFYIPRFFSKVKTVLKSCFHCKRFNTNSLKLNQSSYRLERMKPSEIPFGSCYIDHFGPYYVKCHGIKQKIYLLLITCMFTRAFNSIICVDMTVASFLRAFQMHVHRYGMPSRVISDPGSTLVAGTNLLSSFLSDESVTSYLNQYDIKSLGITQFCKGNSALGSLVESGVKLYKRLIYGFIRNNCLSYHDFEFIISDVNHLVNKRPVAFKEAARDTFGDDIPDPITPEMLIYGRSLPSVGCIPSLHPVDEDPDYVASDNIRGAQSKLLKVRTNMLNLYREEFFSKLLEQAVDQKDRYCIKKHDLLHPGDVVLIKEKFQKSNDYPLALVKQTTINDLGEVTSAILKRGDTGEVVHRHASTLIPLLQLNQECLPAGTDTNFPAELKQPIASRPKREAATKAAKRIADQLL